MSARVTHGESRATTKEYRAWASMKRRCCMRGWHKWHRYGGRGIKVCERWRDSYEAFLADMGRAPSATHSLDRIDNDGDYEPGNCRWATPREQTRNRGNNHVLEFQGRRATAVEWSELTGIKLKTLIERLRHGWPIAAALTIPVGARRAA